MLVTKYYRMNIDPKIPSWRDRILQYKQRIIVLKYFVTVPVIIK